MEGLYPSCSRSTVFGSFYYVTTFVCRLFPFSLFPRPSQPALPWFHGESNTYSFKLTYSVFRLQAYLCHGMSSDTTWCAKTSSEGSVVSRKFLFLFLSLIRLCVQAQPSGTHHDGGSHTTMTRRAPRWRQRCGQLHTIARLTTARRRPDEQHGGGASVGSNTPLRDSQLPDGDTTSGAAATQAAAAQCGMTRNCPTATRRAAPRRHGQQQHSVARHYRPTATRRAAPWRQCEQQHTAARLATAQRRHGQQQHSMARRYR